MLNQTVDRGIVDGGCLVHGSLEKETPMHKRLVTFTLAVLIATPLIVTAAGADRTPGSVPAAVDQLLARDMIQQAQMHLKMAGFDPGRVDGVSDVPTADAVRHYQATQGLPISGLLDEPTRRVMFPGFQAADEG
jgi:peptidoglycan hydrolase-like protein with peptidoglycan-binding domain